MQRTFSKLAIAGAAFVMIVGFTVLMPGQEAQPARQSIAVGSVHIAGLPEDWTHHHLVFSNPGSEGEAIRDATYVDWLKMVNDPRYVIHTLRHRLPAEGPVGEDVARIHEMAVSQAQRTATAAAPAKKPPIIVKPPVHVAQPTAHRDWSVLLGGNGATVGTANYPAKYSFSLIATPLCGNAGTPDYAVYNTSLLGSSTQASIVAYDNLYATSCTGQVPSVYWAFNTGGKIVTSVVLSLDGTQLAFVQTPASGNAQLVLLKWAANPAGHTLTSGATNITNGSKNFTVTSGLSYLDVGAQISGTGIPAGDTIATWTSATAGTLFTAATGNGTSGETLTLTVDAGSPDTLTSNPSYPSCTAPCMITLPFSGSSVTDTLSSPYVDYSGHIIYVGDNSGHLHSFINIFTGATPSEVTTGGWPAAVSANILNSPVYDTSSQKIFLTDSGGYLYAYNTSGTKVMDSSQLAINSGGIAQGPLVDSSTHYVYAFVGRDGSTALNSACGAGSYTSGCSGVFRFPTSNSSTGNTGTTCSQYGTTSYPVASWTTGTNCGSEMIFGEQNGGPNLVYTGAFDHIYYSGSGNTGNLWTCSTTIYQTASCSGANSANTCNNTKLVYVPMASGFSKAVDWGDTAFYSLTDAITTNPAYCTPTTESYGAGGTTNDYVFVGTTYGGDRSGTDCYFGATGSAGGCLYSFLVSSNGTTTIVPVGATDGINAYGGPSGVIIDNTSGATGASQIYYSPVGFPSLGQNDSGGSGIPAVCPEVNGTILVGCAVQASQLALE